MLTNIFVLAIWLTGVLPVTILRARFVIRARFAVQDSHQKYVATTMAIILSGLLIGLEITIVVVTLYDGSTGNLIGAGMWACLVVWDAWSLHKFLKNNDNNWFNKQFKKLKRSLKNLREKLSFSPVLQPAFG